MICSDIVDAFHRNSQIIILSDRKPHCAELQRILLERYGLQARLLTGDTKPDERRRIITGIGSDKAPVIATGQLIGLGLLLLAVLSGVDDLLVQRGLSYRLDIWQAALQRWLGECSLWWGCGNDGVLLLGQFHRPHSGYLAMLYRNGLLGALLFLIFALLYLRYARSPGAPWLLLSLFGWGILS